LLEALFEFHFELLEELPHASLVVYIDKDSNKFIALFLLKISPRAVNRLALHGNRSELSTKLAQCRADQLIWDRLPIIELQRKQNLVASV
jgi:hypothetical protein